jgi:hypothetical protein
MQRLEKRGLLLVVERAQKLPNRVGVALVAVLGEGAQQFARCVLKNQLPFGRFITDAIRARVVIVRVARVKVRTPVGWRA